MFLSIVIPIYNDEKFLNECLDSCLDQNISEEEYEIICVDDGSTDRTPEMLKEYEKEHRNIHVITKEHGRGSGRTVGLGFAKGEYVWFVDHDDIVAPGAVDDLQAIVKANPGCDRVAFPCYEFFNALTPDEAEKLRNGTLCSNDRDAYQDLATWASIIRISFLKEHDILPRSKRIDVAAKFWVIENYNPWSGDTIFLDECLDKGIQSIRITGRPLYHYRRHENTETMSMEPAMVQRRITGKLHTGLLWAYLAYGHRRTYDDERAKSGRASQETADKAVEQVQRTVSYFMKLPSKQWRIGFKKMVEKDIFFPHMPEEYPLSFRTYWRRCTKKERLLPSTAAYYYSITKRGARWSRILSWPIRFLNSLHGYSQRKQQRKITGLKARGLGSAQN